MDMTQKRQVSKAKGGCKNSFRFVSFSSATFIKCPVNIGDALKDAASDRIAKRKFNKVWKDFRLYVKYLDMKVQNPNVGIFQICHSHRYYQRTVKQLIAKDWAFRKNGIIYLRAYQFVWKSLGIYRVDDDKVSRFKYWKIPVETFSIERKAYLKEIEDKIRKRITERKLAQIRYALKEKGESFPRADQATFSAKSASTLFGFTSSSTGSKLRQKYFNVLPMTKEEARPRFNKARGRFEEPTKKIAI
jgi:hypothetical protein